MAITQSTLTSVSTLANAAELTAMLASEVLAPNSPTYNGDALSRDVIASLSQAIFQRELNKTGESC